MFRKIFAAGLLFAMLGGHANSAVPEGTVIPVQTVDHLAHWVEQAMHVSMDVTPVVIVSDSKLRRALRVDDVQRAGAAAAYLPGRIVIGQNVWDENSLKSQSYLVHELVHHAQLVSGRHYPCHAAKEREAYMFQNAWLDEQGLAPAVSVAWVDRMAACPAKDKDQD